MGNLTFAVCDDCGSLVFPASMGIHEAWHDKLQDDLDGAYIQTHRLAVELANSERVKK